MAGPPGGGAPPRPGTAALAVAACAAAVAAAAAAAYLVGQRAGGAGGAGDGGRRWAARRATAWGGEAGPRHQPCLRRPWCKPPRPPPPPLHPAQAYRRLGSDGRRGAAGRARACGVVDGVLGAIGNTPLIRIRSLSEATGCEVRGRGAGATWLPRC
jgi:opacity protein-like surface antigen